MATNEALENSTKISKIFTMARPLSTFLESSGTFQVFLARSTFLQGILENSGVLWLTLGVFEAFWGRF